MFTIFKQWHWYNASRLNLKILSLVCMFIKTMWLNWRVRPTPPLFHIIQGFKSCAVYAKGRYAVRKRFCYFVQQETWQTWHNYKITTIIRASLTYMTLLDIFSLSNNYLNQTSKHKILHLKQWLYICMRRTTLLLYFSSLCKWKRQKCGICCKEVRCTRCWNKSYAQYANSNEAYGTQGEGVSPLCFKHSMVSSIWR